MISSADNPCYANIANYLERHGWLRSVAGERNFNAAVKALWLMYERNLGLMIMGEYGRGKTLLADIVAKAYHIGYKVNLGVTNGVNQLSPEYLSRSKTGPLYQSVYIDDLGAEPRTNCYGEKIEHAENFIKDWHLCHLPVSRLVITTNLDIEQFDERYGGRVLSRLKDLCVFMFLDGKDHRTCTIVDARERRV